MKWESPSQINIFFSLNVSSENPDEIRKAVVRKMADIHPDNNGSVFKNTDVENQWHELQSAKEYLEEIQSCSQLVPLNQVSSIVKAISASNFTSLDTRISLLKEDARSEAKSRIITPRISSGTLAAICGFLFTISDKIKENPLLGQIINASVVQAFLLLGTICAGLFFILTWTQENVLEQQVENLSSELSGKYILFGLLSNKKREDKSLNRFTLEDLIYSLLNPRRRIYGGTKYLYNIYFRSNVKLTRAIAEKIAILQIDRYINRGVVVELPNEGFNRVYEISSAVIDEFNNR